MKRRSWVAALLVATVCAVQLGIGAPAGAAAAHGPIEGSGSSWSAIAMNIWIANVNAQGLQIVFTSSGSAQGRKDFAFKNVDFAVSDIPFQKSDQVSGETDTSNGRPYVYLPIVAGGTSFPYQIRVAGKRVTNLRLSGKTLARIFTNQITNWDDPAITADNNGRRLPSLPIIPVVHSEGSGSTAQFTAYLAKEYPTIWGPFNHHQNVQTEYYPRQGSQVSENGSDGVMNFVGSNAANGSIGFDEYSYALAAGFPVVKLENANGYFTLPTQYNVAKSLTKAVLDSNPASPTYLIQNLDNVYTYADNRDYPLSSYSYMILPTGTNAQDSRLTTPKRQTLADFMYYAICTGQRNVGPVGYSPLPVNLVQDGFDQIQKLKTADPNVDITRRDVSTCNNPTFVAGHPDDNYLAEVAPQPLACDRTGAGPCPEGTVEPGPNKVGAPGAGSPTSKATAPASGGATAAPPGSTVTGTDPNTGQVTTGPGGTTDTAAPTDPNLIPANLANASTSGMDGVLTPLVILELLAVLVVPVLVARGLSRGRRQP